MVGPWAAASTEKQGQPNEAGADKIAVILDQTRETLELVRSLVALLLQQHGDSDGPKLEDLIAVGSSRVDLQACKLEYSIVSPK